MANAKSPSLFGQIEEMLELYLYKKAPALPANVRDLLVKITPWANVVGIIFGLMAMPIIFAALGLGAVVAPFAALGGAGAVQFGAMMFVSVLFIIPILILQIMAAKGLFNAEAKAWKWVFYAQLLSGVSSLISFSIMGVVWALVFIYLLFQIRSSFGK